MLVEARCAAADSAQASKLEKNPSESKVCSGST